MHLLLPFFASWLSLETLGRCLAMTLGSKIAEVRVSKLAANIVCTALTILFCVVGVAIAHLFPHYGAFTGWQAIAFLVSLILLVPVHEGIHAIGLFVFARVSWSDVKFGIMWRALMPYCHCTVPVPIVAYRRMALLPLQITGAGSLIALIVFPTDGLGVLAGIAVAACVGDVWIVAKLRPFADDLLVQDSPSEIGCDVFSSST
jgi:hypothetical protein